MINARFLLKTAHLKRAIFVGTVLTLSFLLISFCAFYAKGNLFFFWIALFAAICTGSVTALGEGTTLGYLKGFPTECMSYFGSGTGFAGIFGTGILLLLKVFDLKDWLIYLISAPTIIPFFISWVWINNQYKAYKYSPAEDIAEQD